MKKILFLLHIILASIINTYAQECNVVSLANDLSDVSQLAETLETKEKFQSWLILSKEKSPLSKNINEIEIVAENLSEVSKQGGYHKWVEWLEKSAPSESELKHLLADTFDKDKRLSKHYRGLIYNYYNQAKGGKTHLWKKIEDLFNEFNLNGGWPLMNGGYNNKNIALKKGDIFDRYQSWFSLGDNGLPIFDGEFTAPVPTTGKYSFPERALRGEESSYKLYYEIEVLKDLPIKGEESTIIPWFNHKGGGKQVLFKFDKSGKYKSLKDLLDDGYIKITIKDIPNGDPKLQHWKNKSFVKDVLNGSEAIISNSNMVVLGKDLNKTIDRLKEFEKINSIGPDNTKDVIDIIVHGADNKILVDGVDISENISDLKKWLSEKYPNSKTVRLLSCTNLEGAQNFANSLGEGYKVHATDGFIRIHNDGAITSVPREIGGDSKWYELTAGKKEEVLNENARPRGPDSTNNNDIEYLNDFLELSNRTQDQINWAKLQELNTTLANKVSEKFKDSEEKAKFVEDLLHNRAINENPKIKAGDLLIKKLEDVTEAHMDAWRVLKEQPNLRKSFSKLEGFSHVLEAFNKLDEPLKKEFLEDIMTQDFIVASQKKKNGPSGSIINSNLLINNIENFTQIDKGQDLIDAWKELRKYKELVNARFSFRDIKNIVDKTFEIEDVVINYGLRDYNLAELLQMFNYPICFKSASATGKVAANTFARLKEKKIDLSFGNKFDDINEAYKVEIKGELKSINDFGKPKDFYDALKNNGFNVFESHHVLVVELFKSRGFRKWYEQIGHTEIDINGEVSLLNVIMLERFKYEKGVHASHNRYNKAMRSVIDDQWNDYINNGSEAQAIIFIGSDIEKIRKGVKKMLVEKSVIGTGKGTEKWERTKVNELITQQDVSNMLK
ncbi:TNT domain-containing protein [uncultured Tenacibaculum sp.]|uniref:TNT domain-containing protein n=1 Tax=uncultured Tenacibaculum sp. TaxID=174713 RepID=UPI00262AC5EA|nr:TNT domain-containing protein [uncultured Tenacibaculum sp.]